MSFIRVPPVQKFRIQARKDQFALEMLSNGFNATKAALAVGVSEASSRSTGMKLSRDPYIVQTLEEAFQRQREAKAITADRILSEVGRIAFANVGDFLDESGKVNILSIMRPEAGAISEVITTETADREGNVTTKVRF